jgi:predicted glycosyltransferase
MKALFYLGHPAHFQLYKNVISELKAKGNECFIVLKKKDILEDLLQACGFDYHNVQPEGKSSSKIKEKIGILKRAWEITKYAWKVKPDVILGTTIELGLVSKISGIPCINVEEDDAAVIPLYAKYSYPFSTTILTPTVCNNGKWDSASVKYKSYHELAYLHPNHFTPDKEVVKKYFNPDETYFIMRFVSLIAHHDKGIQGINEEIGLKLIEALQSYGKIYITSERPLEAAFEPYRLKINPKDIHHVIAFSQLLIGDSQTMAAEAGVLGVPYIRFNDFVGRIGYLEELENHYQLGTGIKPADIDKLIPTVKAYLSDKKLKEKQKERLTALLSDKIDAAKFFVWFIENYPQSVKVMKETPDYQDRFK